MHCNYFTCTMFIKVSKSTTEHYFEMKSFFCDNDNSECRISNSSLKCLYIGRSLNHPKNKIMIIVKGKHDLAPPVQKTPWHAMSEARVMEELGVKSNLKDVGLTAEEAQARIEKYGYNNLTEVKKKSLLERIWAQVNNVLVFILVIVAVVSAIQSALCPPQNLDDPNDPNNSCVVTK